ncbi:hypothetical protein ACQ4PT_066036 [Festuca glaucescens]
MASTHALTLGRLSFLLLIVVIVQSEKQQQNTTVVSNLPGYHGPLPFSLQTGYVEVDESNGIRLFYYFVRLERSPAEDPVLLWLTGGPGRSAFSGLVYEIGNRSTIMHAFSISIMIYTWKVAAQSLLCPETCNAQIVLMQDKDTGYTMCSIWANDRAETVRLWLRCNHGMPYTSDIWSSLEYHRSVTSRGYRSLIYSGDHDMTVPFIGTQAWIRSLGFTIVDEWRPWYVPGQVAGFATVYSNNITFATVKSEKQQKQNTTVVSHLPGYQGPLPFSLQTGYVEVDESNGVRFFYYFVQSEGNPAEDPVLLWLTGGPGCSGFSALVYENGMEMGDRPVLNLKGYILGNPLTDRKTDFAARIPYAHRMGLLSDEQYEIYRESCGADTDAVQNVECTNCLESIDKEAGYTMSSIWANDKAVRAALGVHNGTVRSWLRCNHGTPYTGDISSSVEYHRSVTTRGYRSIIYSGDHDITWPFIGTQVWIRSLSFPAVDEWRPWYVTGQVAGFATVYSNNLTFATVKGAGHTAPEYKPKECLAMMSSWLSNRPL